MSNGTCIIGQSGGPTAVINASVLGIVEKAFEEKCFDEVYGAINGISGVLNENFTKFSLYNKGELKLLKTTPAAALGSVRFRMPDDLGDPVYKRIEEVFIKYDVRAFFYIGGNDSMDTCMKLAKFFKGSSHKCSVLGIPKTIDNDMVITDHTPGYPSAAKFIATTIAEMYEDINSYKKGRVTLVEIMGRDSGWLTASTFASSIVGASPDLIYLPEKTFKLDEFLEDVKAIYEKKQKVFVAISEGIKDENGMYFLQKRLYNQNDDFGHLQLGGVGMVLAEIVNKELNLPVRSVEINILQRCASHLLSKTDIDEAYNLGAKGVEFALLGESGKTVCMKRCQTDKYEVTYFLENIETIANKVKAVPDTFINERGNGIKNEFLDYLLPLIQGEVERPLKSGIPRYFKLKK